MVEIFLTEQDLGFLTNRPKRVVRTAPPSKPTTVTKERRVQSKAWQQYHSKPLRLGRAVSTFVLTFVVIFAVVNMGAYVAKVGYWWNKTVAGEENVAKEQEIIHDAASNLPPNKIFIPKISVEAPVVWNSPPSRLIEDLQRGVAHYQGSALPNFNTGNVFITGHSSFYPWDPGQFKQIFANLDKLAAGDYITLTTATHKFVYRVTGSVVVKPEEVQVLGPTPNPIVSLMTCTPVGTNLKRLIVQGELMRVRPLSGTN